MRGTKLILKECKATAITDLLNLVIKPVQFTPILYIHWTKLTTKFNSNRRCNFSSNSRSFYHATKCKYAKNSKKVRFCRFYWFLCKKTVPSLPPRTNFCPSAKLCNILYVKYLQSFKWALKKTLHRKVSKLELSK